MLRYPALQSWSPFPASLLICMLACSPISYGLTCYKCNSTDDPTCSSDHPFSQEVCPSTDYPYRHGCFSLLINNLELIKGCSSTPLGPPSSPSHIRTCVNYFARFEVEKGKCAKRELSRRAFDRFTRCRSEGIQPGAGEVNDDDPGEVEMTFCLCDEDDLCNRSFDASDMEWATKLKQVRHGVTESDAKSVANSPGITNYFTGIILLALVMN